jgi:hypothetical protein
MPPPAGGLPADKRKPLTLSARGLWVRPGRLGYTARRSTAVMRACSSLTLKGFER